MRLDTNKIALRAIRTLLGGAKPFEVDAGATKVTCSMTAVPPEAWPTGAEELVETEDVPWPSSVAVDCRWNEGACRLMVEPFLRRQARMAAISASASARIRSFR
jgi:hypothetical protein